MDYAEGTLLFVVKDTDWNENQIQSAQRDPFHVVACETNGLLIFLLEGGPLDTCDFYFNIQDCDEKEKLLADNSLPVQALLVDGDNTIVAVKSATLSRQATQALHALFEKQDQMDFMPGEYDCNVEGMQAAFEPAELGRYEKLSFDLH